MDKSDNNFSGLSHAISINERKNIVVSGVKKIESFDNEEFLMETNMGYIIIKGQDLELIKLDTFQGNVSIKGKFNSLGYIENIKKKDKDEGIFNKLFK